MVFWSIHLLDVRWRLIWVYNDILLPVVEQITVGTFTAAPTVSDT